MRSSGLAAVSGKVQRKRGQTGREFARTGRYYATESMLVWDEAAGRYDPDATPEFGNGHRWTGTYARFDRGRGGGRPFARHARCSEGWAPRPRAPYGSPRPRRVPPAGVIFWGKMKDAGGVLGSGRSRYAQMRVAPASAIPAFAASREPFRSMARLRSPLTSTVKAEPRGVHRGEVHAEIPWRAPPSSGARSRASSGKPSSPVGVVWSFSKNAE